ncbi:MAG TPA: branched-chain amino acid aminotransferase [Clostridia bacterium]|nr:branched-chain amino acid aminotransferase [Clostridia bacterium]HRU84699.1 branched-chain amino acid aminotransferase [Eubacteriales bacterium]
MKIRLASVLKEKPDAATLGFGRKFTDHMLIMDYDENGWGEPEIVPYGDMAISPAASCLHYGQTIFDGFKAYCDVNGDVVLFRAKDNIARINASARRLCMAELPIDITFDAIAELVRLEKDWIPRLAGTSLYIRPTMIATEPFLGVHASRSYRFFVILSPVGSYYAGGLAPTKIYVEDNYARAAKGGTGESKCGGNYAASLIAAEAAHESGFEQVLWLDSAEKKYVEEVGAMNMFFVIGKTVVTPALSGSILRGITRDSVIKLLRASGYAVEECAVTIDEIVRAYKASELKEAFGTGTAAVISPVGFIKYKDVEMKINGGEIGEISGFIYDRLTGLQTGRYPDPFGWVIKL